MQGSLGFGPKAVGVVVPPPPPPPAADREQQVAGSTAGAGVWPSSQQPSAAPTGLAVASSSETHGRALDAVVVKAIEDAVAAAHARTQGGTMPSAPAVTPTDHFSHGSRSGKGDIGDLERLRSEIRECHEDISRTEERARKAEERVQTVERELGDTKQQLKEQLDHMRQQQRRQQEESNSSLVVRELEQQMQSLRRELEQQVQSLRRQHSDDKSIMASIQRDLEQERQLRHSLETRVSDSSGMLQDVLKVDQNALRVAESAQQGVRQLRQEKNSDEDRLALAVSRVERSTCERIDALECKMEKHHLDQLRTLSTTPSKINFLQAMHAKSTGRRFGGGPNGTALRDVAEADTQQRSEQATRSLLR